LEQPLLIMGAGFESAGIRSMNDYVRASIIGLAAVTLVACASTGSARSKDRGTAADELAREYQRLIDNAMGQPVCHLEAVTGSRIRAREVCLTRAARDAAHERVLALLQDLKEHR
jgi:hypothetical protein